MDSALIVGGGKQTKRAMQSLAADGERGKVPREGTVVENSQGSQPRWWGNTRNGTDGRGYVE